MLLPRVLTNSINESPVCSTCTIKCPFSRNTQVLICATQINYILIPIEVYYKLIYYVSGIILMYNTEVHHNILLLF